MEAALRGTVAVAADSVWMRPHLEFLPSSVRPLYGSALSAGVASLAAVEPTSALRSRIPPTRTSTSGQRAGQHLEVNSGRNRWMDTPSPVYASAQFTAERAPRMRGSPDVGTLAHRKFGASSSLNRKIPRGGRGIPDSLEFVPPLSRPRISCRGHRGLLSRKQEKGATGAEPIPERRQRRAHKARAISVSPPLTPAI